MAQGKRGRPRKYSEELALNAALSLFWSRGFSATSLDALSEVTGMKRPSLYAAFGNKRALFSRALLHFQGRMRSTSVEALKQPKLLEALETLFEQAVSVYAPSHEPALGCFVFGVASLEATVDADLKTAVATAIKELDSALQTRFHEAVTTGELPKDTDTPTLARIASSVIHSLSLRARAGEDRETLLHYARSSAALLTKQRS